MTILFPKLGKFLTILQIFSHILSFYLLLLGPYNSNVGVFNVAPEVSETGFIFILFLYSVLFQLFPPLDLPVHSFVFLPQ